MALRTRPLKFSLWHVTRMQRRSCRFRTECRSVGHNDRLVSYGLSECATTCVPGTNSNLLQEVYAKERDKEDDQIAIMQQHYRDILMWAWTDQTARQITAGTSDVNKSLRCLKTDINICDVIPENHIDGDPKDPGWTGSGQCIWPYTHTGDDMLFGMCNSSVNSATTQINPLLVEELFRHELLPVKKTKLSENTSCTNDEVTVQKLLSTPTAAESVHTVDQGDDTSVTSDFFNFMEYFLNGAFALEKTEEPLAPTVVTEDDTRIGCLHVGKDLPGVMYCSGLSSGSEGSKTPIPGKENKPSMQQLVEMQDFLAETLPKLFVQRHEYRIYTQDVVFENNYFTKPYVTVGLNNYGIQVAKLRIMAHFKFANVRIHILKITVHEEDGSVRVRWRLSGIPQSRAFMFWKFLPWHYSKRKTSESEWHDGFSTFYLDSHGMIAKHRMDRVMPEEEPVVVKKEAVVENINPGLAA